MNINVFLLQFVNSGRAIFQSREPRHQASFSAMPDKEGRREKIIADFESLIVNLKKRGAGH